MSSSRVLDGDSSTSSFSSSGDDRQRFVSQSDDSIGTQKQLKDEMSVDLVNAQMAEAWRVQQKRWKPQLRQEGTRDGQSSEVLKNQNMLRIMSENEKCLSYSLEVNHFTDSTQEKCESTYLGYKHQNVS